MISAPKHTSARVTKDAVQRIAKLQEQLKEKDLNVKKFQLWDEAVKLLEENLKEEGMIDD
jgi:hypothetical protein